MKHILSIITVLFILLKSSVSWGEKQQGKSCVHGRPVANVTNFAIGLSHEKTILKTGCQSVSSTNGVEPLDGEKMIMITLPPNYCSQENNGWDDCYKDRSRIEFYDKKGVKKGKTVTYDYWMYIPSDTDLLQNGIPIVYLGQLNTKTKSHYSSLVMVKWDEYGGIIFQVYNNFNFRNFTSFLLMELMPELKQRDNWINIKYVVDVYDDERGSLEIFVDGTSIVKKEKYPTIKKNGHISLKMGIYDYKVSLMGPNRSDQKIYFDNIKRTVKSSF